MNLIFDTETTGLPNPNLPPDDPAQPLPIQLAWVVEDINGRVIEARAALLNWGRVCGVEAPIHPDAEKAHGITQDMLDQYGYGPSVILNEFACATFRCDRIVAHNLPFDLGILHRAQEMFYLPHTRFAEAQQVCTMQRATPLCRIPTAGGSKRYKAPNLAEAYRYFTRRDLSGAHDALTDVYACRAVWHGIQRAEAVLNTVPIT